MSRKLETEYRCMECGGTNLQRRFYVWREEGIDDDSIAFDIPEAEPTEMGDDFYCHDCEMTTDAWRHAIETPAPGPDRGEITLTLTPELAMALSRVHIADYLDSSPLRELTQEKRGMINQWVGIKARLREEAGGDS